MEEKQLIQALKKGEEKAFEVFVQRYGDRLYRSLYFTLRDEEKARDLVQDTFVKVIRYITNFNGRSKLYTWVYRIAANQMKDEFKKRQAEPMDAEDLPIATEHVEEDAVRQYHHRQVARGLREIPFIYRQVLVLYYFEEMKIREITEVLAESEGTVKSRLFRGKKALKEKLIEKEVFHEKETL